MTSNTKTARLSPLDSLLAKDKFNGTNFLEWYRNLTFFLKKENKLYILEAPVPDEPNTKFLTPEKKLYDKHVKDSLHVTCIMLATMDPSIEKELGLLDAYNMITRLKKISVPKERFELVRGLVSCKMVMGTSLTLHVLKMKGYIDDLDMIGYPLRHELAIDVILNSLPESFENFVKIYHMNNVGTSVLELLEMLKTYQKNMNLKAKRKKGNGKT